MAANHTMSKVLNVPMAQVVNMMRDKVFEGALNVELKSENPTPTGVWYRFHHGVSFSSWGEKITITLSPAGQFATNVDIRSECGMPTQVIDWGKNKRNVCNIFEYIEANIAKYPQVYNGPVIPTQPIPMQQPAGSKFCLSCGEALPVTAAFCGKCGAKQ